MNVLAQFPKVLSMSSALNHHRYHLLILDLQLLLLITVGRVGCSSVRLRTLAPRRSVPRSVNTVSTTGLACTGALRNRSYCLVDEPRGRVWNFSGDSVGGSLSPTGLEVSSKMGFRTNWRVEEFLARKLSRLKSLWSISCSNWDMILAGISISLSALDEAFVKYPRSIEAGRGEGRFCLGRLRADRRDGGGWGEADVELEFRSLCDGLWPLFKNLSMM